MKNQFNLTYFDRSRGDLLTERVFAAGFLHWSYNSRLGRAVTRWVLAQRWVSRCCGWLARRRWSRHLIASFAGGMKFDLAAGKGWTCFNDYFVRELEESSSMNAVGPWTCLSPVESKVLVLRDVDPRKTFRVKRSIFNLEQLLSDRQLSERFAGGTAVLCRLTLSDYHHFHFPVAGCPQPAFAIPGKLYAGGPYAINWLTSFYAENFRMVTLIESDLFGTVAQIEIGAFTVGSIHQRYLPGRHVERGEKKGYFELGGSTVVLLFAAGALETDEDLRHYSGQNIETRLRVGESIGRVAGLCPQVAGPV
jgi:phosphatidylserine decarboxylase